MGIIAADFLQWVIRPTLKSIDLWSKAAEKLLLATAAHESLLGKYLKQRGGIALGVYQIEPNTHEDVWVNYLLFRPMLANKIIELVNLRGKLVPNKNELITNLSYATAIARIIYYRVPAMLPDEYDEIGLAKYWKKYYNTIKGKGSIKQFINHYRRYCHG